MSESSTSLELAGRAGSAADDRDVAAAGALLAGSLAALAGALPQLAAPLAVLARRMAETLRSGGRIFWFGNGGSAAQAQHAAAELVGRFERERPGFAAASLTVDTSILTAIANDYGYENVFARQVNALVRHGDLVVGISTSGRSVNVARGLAAARERGAGTAALTGADPGALAHCSDVVVAVGLERTALVQEAHQVALHALCSLVEAALAEP